MKMAEKGQTKYTYEFVKSKFEEIGYELLSKEYTGVRQKLEYICSKHKEEGILTITFDKFMKGQRCRFCARENTPNSRVSDEKLKEYCDKLNFQFIKSHMVNHVTCIDFICNKHKDKGIQTTMWINLKKIKIGCKYCCGKGKTTEDFKKELCQINPNITVLGEYINATTKIKCKCNIDGNEWKATPNTLLRPEGCPICGMIQSKTKEIKSHDTFIKQMKIINPDIEVLNKYTTVFDVIKCKCKIDGFEWETTPNSILNQKSKCPMCTKKKMYESQIKSNEQFLKELKLVNPNILPLEEYQGDKVKIKCKCLIHNYEWYVAPCHILHRKTGCPKCSKYTNEIKIHEILEDYNIEYTAQKRYNNCRDKYSLPFDFYLKQYDILIEYDGEGHYRPIRRGHMTEDDALNNFKLVQTHDKIKNEYCIIHNIPLIRIPYWEKDNLECFLFEQLNAFGININ